MSLRTAAEWDALVEASIVRGKQEILAEMSTGRIPATVDDFATLHDYIDANELGGLCEEGWLQYTQTPTGFDGEMTADCHAAASRVQDALHAWLQGGRA